MKVLVAEDERVNLILLQKLLHSWNYEVVSCVDGVSAWEMLQKDQEISLALIDWMMPGLEGPEICQRVRKEILDRYVYIIMLTGKTGVDDLIEGMNSGADQYLLKPVKSYELQTQLRVGERISTLQRELLIEGEKLKSALSEKSLLLESIPSFFITVNEQDKILTWNRAAEQLFNIKSSEAIGTSLLQSNLSWDWCKILSVIDECHVRGTTMWLDEVTYKTNKQTNGYLELALSPILKQGKQYAGLILLGQDITRRKQLEHELVHAHKMESIGQLASGIAHEINTPTQYVGDNTRFVKESFSKINNILARYDQLLTDAKAGKIDAELVKAVTAEQEQIDLSYLREELPTALEQTLEGVQRVTHIVRAMKEFTHPGTQDKSAIDVNHVLENTITVCRNEWKYVAEVVTNFDKNLPPFPCYPNELTQAFLNLIVNAAHAIQDVVKTGAIQRGQITVSTEQHGSMIEVRIADSGTGIPEAIRSRIFDPFFTTKEVGRGTGQGLKVCYDVVTALHRGSIDFETEIGKGTTFIMRLPLLLQQEHHAEQNSVR